MSQKEFDELIQEIEDMLLNKDIDISNSPELRKKLEQIISKYVNQVMNQVQQDNYKCYKQRSNQAIYEVKQKTINDFKTQFKSINKRIASLNYRVNQHSVLANKINRNGSSLEFISNKIDQSIKNNHKSTLILNISKSRFLMIISSSFLIGVVLATFLFIFIKLF